MIATHSARTEGPVLGRMSYQEYLKTDWWKQRSEHMKRLAFYCCERCHLPDRLNCHHRVYQDLYNKSIWFRERDEDLEVLCQVCHTSTHLFKMLQERLDGRWRAA